jgi:hypothetical protein
MCWYTYTSHGACSEFEIKLLLTFGSTYCQFEPKYYNCIGFLCVHPRRKKTVEIFVLRKDKLCMEKPVITQKIVLKIKQICVASTQNFPTQARFQHKSDFEHTICFFEHEFQ